VVQHCRAATAKPLWVKLSPNVASIVPFAQAAAASGADALTVSNTLMGMLVDWRRRRPVLANGTGGMSGPAVRPLVLRLVWEASRAVGIPVIASGGASSADDVLDYIVAGATAVQVGTAVFRRPGVVSEIAAELRRALTEENTSLEELRASLEWPFPLSC
jgi:dihydroorotate dehydrogenase (NAD+) catalytic subunit